jgi:hypothetical protein
LITVIGLATDSTPAKGYFFAGLLAVISSSTQI